MRIIHKKDVPRVVKPEGTDVTYYLFDDYELHHNIQVPGSTQTWHHHQKISETLYMLSGELLAEWKEGGEAKSKTIAVGDLVEVGASSHTFSNKSNENAEFIIIKRVPEPGTNHRETFKKDKMLD